MDLPLTPPPVPIPQRVVPIEFKKSKVILILAIIGVIISGLLWGATILIQLLFVAKWNIGETLIWLIYVVPFVCSLLILKTKKKKLYDFSIVIVILFIAFLIFFKIYVE